MRSAFIVAAGAALAVAAGLVAVAGAVGGGHPVSAGPAAARPVTGVPSVGPAAFGPTDVAWLQLLTPMTDQAVRLAALARTRATDPGLRSLAGSIATAHGAELTRLRACEQRAGVGGQDVHAGHDMPGMTTAAEYAAAEQAAGGAFDRIVVDHLREYLEQSVKLAGSEDANGTEPGVRQLAADLARSRSAALSRLDAIAARQG